MSPCTTILEESIAVTEENAIGSLITRSEIISDTQITAMTDLALVDYVGTRIVKFAMEIRPLVVEVHTRFMAETKAGRKFVGYTNFDKFCEDFWNYTGRQIRNIINGTPTPKRLPAPPATPAEIHEAQKQGKTNLVDPADENAGSIPSSPLQDSAPQPPAKNFNYNKAGTRGFKDKPHLNTFLRRLMAISSVGITSPFPSTEDYAYKECPPEAVKAVVYNLSAAIERLKEYLTKWENYVPSTASVVALAGLRDHGLATESMQLVEVHSSKGKRAMWKAYKKHHYAPDTFNVAARVFKVIPSLDRNVIGMTACLPLPSGTLQNAWRSHKVVVLPEFKHLWRVAADTQAKILVAEGKRYFCNASDAPADLIAYRDDLNSGWVPTSKHGKTPKDTGHGEKFGNLPRSVNEHGLVVSHEFIGMTSEDGAEAAPTASVEAA
jgi:hypothetical protein